MVTSSSSNSSRRSSSDSQFLLRVKPPITNNEISIDPSNSVFHQPSDPYYTFFHSHDLEEETGGKHGDRLDNNSDDGGGGNGDGKGKEIKVPTFHFPSENMPQYIENVILSKKPQYDAKLMKKLSKCIILPEDPV